MFCIDNLLNTAPYSLGSQQKRALYLDVLQKLTSHHYQHCLPYRNILDSLNFNVASPFQLPDLPFMPVRLFKTHDLRSVDSQQVVKTMRSSGTSGQQASKIFLDKHNASAQTKVLTSIVRSFLGDKRLPMLVIDSPAVLKNRALFSARGAGILGFSMLGRDLTYALDDNMQLDLDAVNAFCEKHQGKHILVFGFTYIVWSHFYQQLAVSKQVLPLDNATLIHGGGWKKLVDMAVDNDTFKRELQVTCGIQRIHNYYGMIEQTGSIFMECESGYLHSSIYSDIIIRDKQFNACKNGTPGMIQLISLLPSSYPGHSILSEDMGVIVGEDDCTCGRLGKYFHVHGRIKQAEIRGCSDTYASNET